MSDDTPSAALGPGLSATIDGSAETASTQPGSGTAHPVVSLNTPDWLRQWDRYEILSFLGQGGMGVVYQARDRRLQRVVALKFISAISPKTAQRFTQEARAQARITNENICRVFEVGEVAGQTYIAMEYLPGEPLHLAQRRLLVPQKLQLIKDLAEALHAAHLQGVIHREPYALSRKSVRSFQNNHSPLERRWKEESCRFTVLVGQARQQAASIC